MTFNFWPAESKRGQPPHPTAGTVVFDEFLEVMK